MTVTVRPVETSAALDEALAVRRTVFVDEQGVPPELEVDDFDTVDAATHVVAYDDDEAIGAARVRPDDHDGEDVDDRTYAKVERVAVLAERRGEGIGARLMDVVEATAEAQGYDGLVLHAQTDVEGFYDARGYRRVGAEFIEAGIPHIKMFRNI